jgi:cytochrome oxidase Cu insertion factor (SCO1/SenC/PrrC family)
MLANRILRFFVIVSMSVMTQSALAQESSTEVSSHPMIGETAPSFDLQEVNGGSLDLEGLRGRYVVIHFGTSW